MTGLDLTEPVAEDDKKVMLSQRLAGNTMLRVDVLWALCSKQAESRNVSDEQFAELLGGTTLLAASKAFFEEWGDFFRQCDQEAVAEAIEQVLKMQATIAATVRTQMDRLLPEINKRIELEITTEADKALAELASGKLFTARPESQELTPVSSP